MMLQTLVMDESRFGPIRGLAALIPSLILLSLSATGRSSAGEVWGLTEADVNHPIAKRRLEATKRLSFRESDASTSLSELLAEEAWGLSNQGAKPVRVIVFSNSRDVAEKAKAAIEQLAKGNTRIGIDPVTIAVSPQRVCFVARGCLAIVAIPEQRGSKSTRGVFWQPISRSTTT